MNLVQSQSLSDGMDTSSLKESGTGKQSKASITGSKASITGSSAHINPSKLQPNSKTWKPKSTSFHIAIFQTFTVNMPIGCQLTRCSFLWMALDCFISG